ncbi:MAG: LysM domain [Verrucomicrobiota bacterium]
MKLPKLLTRKTLRAATARRSLGAPDEMDYEEMSEPNMKLSRALLIVLVLHVVAVAGIIAFNTIKARQGPLPPPVSTTNNTSTSMKTENTSTRAPVSTAPLKPVVKEERKAERPKPTENSPAKPDAAKTYIVAKGDNPVTISKRFKVPYDELMAANHIDDPHKLKIGQKLIIPTKPNKQKKAD